MTRALSTTTLIAGLLLGDLSFAGWSSNGGDLLKDQHNPWFLGNESVEYCVEIAGPYPIGLDAAKAIVASSLKKWTDFFKSYGVDRIRLGEKAEPGKPYFADFKARGLSLDFHESQNCGVEPDGKILFLFGRPNSVVESVRNNGASTALGLAIHRDYDHRAYRTGGIVWISDFSQARSHVGVGDLAPRIEHLLLHEVGHVFGMRHDSVFVMDAAIGAELVAPDWECNHKSHFGQIETPLWRFRLRDGDTLNFSYNKGAGLGSPNGVQPASELPAEIRRESGISPGGLFRLFVETRLWATDSEQHRSFTLVIQDATNGKGFRMAGDFPGYSRSAPSDFGPGLWTRWLTGPGVGDFREFRNLFDSVKDPIPAKGHFEVSGKKYPAIVSWDRGPKLEVFLPEAGYWWTQKNFKRNFPSLGAVHE